MKTKHGFTLVELSIAMAVAAIAIALLIGFLTLAKTFTETKQTHEDFHYEISTFQQSLDLALENFQIPSFLLRQANGESKLEFLGQNEMQTISFSDGSLWLNQTCLKSFHQIQSANFQTQGNIIKCTLQCELQPAQTLVFYKRI